MNRVFLTLIFLCAMLMVSRSELFARGGGRGGGGARMGGGGGARAGGGGFSGGSRMSAPARTPSMSRPSMPYQRPSMPSNSFSGAARPSTGYPRPSTPNIGTSRPAVGSRPGAGSPSAGSRPSIGSLPPGGTRPGVGTGRPGVGNNFPGTGTNRPGTGITRPGAGVATRPSAGQINDFLNLKPSVGGGPAMPARGGNMAGSIVGGIAGGIAGGAAADFLRDSGARPSTLPSRPGDVTRPGDGLRPGAGVRPAPENRPLVGSRPDRIENREQFRNNREGRRDEIRDHIDNDPIRDFWSENPGWAAWRLTAPYRWATWGAVSSWVGYGWSEPYPYSYGENVYYQDNSVYYGDQPVATAEEYATQAQTIIEAAPEIAPEKAEWMPLGVFALTQDGKASGPEPTLFLQLAISKEGQVSGTLRNETADTTQAIEGMADKESQRAAWAVTGKTRPIMETGIANLAEDSSGALVHFADGQTQQWMMVRLNEPNSKTGN